MSIESEDKNAVPKAYTSIFFNPKTVFFRSPIPRRLWESHKTAGNDVPVLDSVTEDEFSERESEPHKGFSMLPLCVKLDDNKLSAF